ncbi:MAG: hypothetical protein QOH53_2311 [Ilumatobacteraceae bacterium]
MSDETDDCEEIVDGDVTWRLDRGFLTSNWTCIWGRGCKGILDVPAEHLNQGCCSIGAELADPQEAMTISALAATLDPEFFQFHEAIDADDVFSDGARTNTKVVDGACIFLNRPGFEGGEGCALHIAATRAGESPTGWKPSVCWQLPIKVDWEPSSDGRETATLRRWARRDWGDDGDSMHWCCTEGTEAYIGDRMVVDSLADELTEVLGEPVYVELRRRLR